MAFDLAPFLERRRRFAEALGESLAIIPAGREAARNADTDFEFRQDSDFYFLTGFDEPDAVAVFNPAHAKERFVLFVRPRDRELEIWTGRRAGVEGAIATYGADAAYTIDELDARLREYAVDRPGLVYRLGNPHHDARVIRLVNEMDSDHPMHHPFHLHGAGRFLVLSRDGVVEPNLVWKDTVLVRTGQVVDILFDVSNPGLWMAHCHIAEHMQSGMMFSFNVARTPEAAR